MEGLGQEHTAVSRAVAREASFSPAPPLPSQYIVAFAAKVLTGQVRELKDLREYDVAEAQSLKPSKAE